MSSRPSIELKSQRFRDERASVWKDMEALLSRFENSGLRNMSDSDLVELPKLYRATLSSLSVARSTSLDQSVIAYLESLSERAYYVIYGNQVSIWTRIANYLVRGLPLAVQAAWKDLAVATLIFGLGAALGWGMVAANPDWFYNFVDEGLASGRTPAASTEYLKSTLYGNEDDGMLSAFASYLFSHNSRVAILIFSLGFAFAIPSIVLLLMNGLMLGAFVAVFTSRDLGFEVGGWLFIHGTTEIFAIILAAAGGFMIGRAVAFPGDKTRLESLSDIGQTAATLLGGVIIMLFCAGLLEGFGRQLINSDFARYAIGSGMLIFWMFYFFTPRRAKPIGYRGL